MERAARGYALNYHANRPNGSVRNTGGRVHHKVCVGSAGYNDHFFPNARFRRKKSVSMAPQGSAITPPRTTARWFKRVSVGIW